MTQLCITVIGKDAEAIRQGRMRAEADADLVELRLDSMTSPDPDAALADRKTPAIVTCRPLREGGMFDGSEEERLRILLRAQALGAELVDIEWDIQPEPFLAARGGRGVVVSRHDFQGVPDDLPALRSGFARRRGRRWRSWWNAPPTCENCSERSRTMARS